MNKIRALAGRLLGPSKVAQEYQRRFIHPPVQRLLALGVTDAECDRLVAIAFKTAMPTVIGLAPGSILNDMADQIEAGRTAQDIIEANR